LALNPPVGLRAEDLFNSAGILIKAMMNEPRVAIAQWLSFLGEITDIVVGKSERVPQAAECEVPECLI
jgi:polyhydroxyalkanoate synthase subunit PhaC